MSDPWIETREKVAALEHEQWAHWTAYMLRILTARYPELNKDENVLQWSWQILTKYEDLTEEEKNSDRKWAEKGMYLFRDLVEYI